MAVKVEDAYFELSIRDARFRQGLKTAETQMGRLGTVATRLGSQFKTALGLSMAAAAAAMVYGLKQSVAAMHEFDMAMAKSTAIMGNLTDAMRKDMRQAAIQMSKDTIFSAKEAADSFFYLASAGMSARESLQALPIVAQFAQSGMFDMARATDILTDAQSALGMSIRDDVLRNTLNIERLGDVLVKANTLANASVEQFSEALTNHAAPALRMVGKSAEEGVAVLAAYADQGIKGAHAGTALAIVLRDLSTKAIDNEEEFKKYGVRVFDTAGNMRKLWDIIKDVEDALAGMNDKQKKATLLNMEFTDRSVGYLMSLLGMSDRIKMYATELEKAGGVTKEVAQKNMTEMQKALDRTKGAVSELIFEQNVLTNAVKDFAIIALDVFSEVAKGVRDVLHPIETLADRINAIRDFLFWITNTKAPKGFPLLGEQTKRSEALDRQRREAAQRRQYLEEHPNLSTRAGILAGRLGGGAYRGVQGLGPALGTAGGGMQAGMGWLQNLMAKSQLLSILGGGFKTGPTQMDRTDMTRMVQAFFMGSGMIRRIMEEAGNVMKTQKAMKELEDPLAEVRRKAPTHAKALQKGTTEAYRAINRMSEGGEEEANRQRKQQTKYQEQITKYSKDTSDSLGKIYANIASLLSVGDRIPQ